MTNFCPQCGVTFVEGSKFCANCGVALLLNRAESPAPVTIPTNIATLLCYAIPLVGGIIFLNLEPYRHERALRFHAWQSIYFAAAWMGITIFPQIFFFLPLLWLIVVPLYCAFFVVWIILMVKAYQGEAFKLPLLGDLAQKQAAR